MAAMDYKSSRSQKLIGKIVNLSAILNAIYMDKLSKGQLTTDDEMQDLYKDITKLDICSGFAIDGSKKSFGNLSISKELTRIIEKWVDKEISDPDGNTASDGIKKKYEQIRIKKKEIYKLEDEMDEYTKDKNESKFTELNKELKKNKKELYAFKKELKCLKEEKEKDKIDKKDRVKKYKIKIIKPEFFDNVTHEKNPNFITKYYNCTMDNILEILKGNNKSNNTDKDDNKKNKVFTNRITIKDKKSLLQYFVPDIYEDEKIDYDKMNKFIKDVNETEEKCTNLNIKIKENKNTDKDEMKKNSKTKRDYRSELVSRWENRLNSKTIKKIISDLGHKDDNNKNAKRIINTLYKSNPESYLSLFIVNKSPVMNGIRPYKHKEQYDIVKSIFGRKFAPYQVTRKFTCNNKTINFGENVTNLLLKPDVKE